MESLDPLLIGQCLLGAKFAVLVGGRVNLVVDLGWVRSNGSSALPAID